MKQADQELMEQIFGQEDEQEEGLDTSGLEIDEEEMKRHQYYFALLDGFVPTIKKMVFAGHFFILAPVTNISYREN